MAKQYSPHRFFRSVPNHFLKQYFDKRNLLGDVSFETLPETQVDTIYSAWLQLPEKERGEIEQDFQDIDHLATESGSKAILDEARWHGEDLAEQFSRLDGVEAHAFWTFLERPQYWPAALAFHHADTIPSSYWRKRKNLPPNSPYVDQASIYTFEQRLGHYFYSTSGRGKNCKVECYRRNDLDYFFAYPEDYAQASIEWKDQAFTRRLHNPAFEVIFVYSQKEGSLDVYLSGGRRAVPDLQAIFAEIILKISLEPDVKDERVYDLSCLRDRHFQFLYAPELGIENVIIKKIRLKIQGKNERITLEAASDNRHALFDLLDKIDIPLSQIFVSQVGIQVTFSSQPHSKRSAKRTFDISWPNSCSLKHEGRDLIIRKVLIDSGIEAKEPAENDAVFV